MMLKSGKDEGQEEADQVLCSREGSPALPSMALWRQAQPNKSVTLELGTHPPRVPALSMASQFTLWLRGQRNQ